MTCFPARVHLTYLQEQPKDILMKHVKSFRFTLHGQRQARWPEDSELKPIVCSRGSVDAPSNEVNIWEDKSF